MKLMFDKITKMQHCTFKSLFKSLRLSSEEMALLEYEALQKLISSKQFFHSFVIEDD
jgi:hypothetical protein